MFERKVKTKKGEVWEFTEELHKDPITGKRKRISARGKTRGEAKAKLQKKILNVTEHGLTTDPKQSMITFEKMTKLYLDEINKPTTKDNTRVSREQHAKRILKYLAKIPIRNITRKMYQNAIDQMEIEYGYNTIVSSHAFAKNVFKKAKTWDVIKESPAEGAVIPQKALTVDQLENDPVAQNYLESSEVKKFLSVVDKYGSELDSIMFTLLPFTGMRIGELLALKWSDIDYELKEIRITKSLSNPNHVKTGYKLVTPKTKRSIRKIAFDEQIEAVFLRLKALQNEWKMKNRKIWLDENFIITDERGYPLDQHFVRWRMERLAKHFKQAGLHKKIHPHLMRHTHTSLLTEAGADLRAIMQRLGHTNSKTTLSVYTHVTNKMKQETADKLGDVFGNLINR